MTLFEACERFSIDKEKLQYYERSGLLDCHRQPDGNIDYSDETLEYIGLVDLLVKAGLNIEAIKIYLSGLRDNGISAEEQIKILVKQRYALLDDIHDKEKILRQLDYIIYKSREKD